MDVCQHCSNEAIVGLNNMKLCLDCFKKAMKGVGQAVSHIKKCVEEPRSSPGLRKVNDE